MPGEYRYVKQYEKEILSLLKIIFCLPLDNRLVLCYLISGGCCVGLPDPSCRSGCGVDFLDPFHFFYWMNFIQDFLTVFGICDLQGRFPNGVFFILQVCYSSKKYRVSITEICYEHSIWCECS